MLSKTDRNHTKKSTTAIEQGIQVGRSPRIFIGTEFEASLIHCFPRRSDPIENRSKPRQKAGSLVLSLVLRDLIDEIEIRSVNNRNVVI
jgi:hypothetical protein